jgi:TolB-like protein
MQVASKITLFLTELKRRKVYRVAAVYAVVGVGILGAAEVILEPLNLGNVRPAIVILVLLGFPIALVLAWAYEVRPEERPRVSAGAAGGGYREEAAPAPSESRTEPAREGQPSIVVLPFENLSPDPDNAFFADGLTEEIIADLSKVRALRVISRTSALAFKGTTKTVPAIAQELNVRFVLEGSVRREAKTIRITAQLIDASSDTHLWAEKYAGTVEDVFDLQEQLSRRIVDALKVELSPEEDRRLGERPITDVQAHDIWLRARQHALTLTIDGVSRAKELVEQALSFAGDNALLHATLCWIYAVRWGLLTEEADQALSLARKHADIAMSLDPDLPWSLFAQAIVRNREGDAPGFLEWGKRVLEVERDSHTLAVLSLNLSYAGCMEVARSYAEEAVSLDPLSWLTAHTGPLADLYDGKAARSFQRLSDLADRLAPGEAWPTFQTGYAALQAGMDDEARSWFGRCSQTGSPLYAALLRAFTLVMENDRDRAVEVLGTPVVTTVAQRIGGTSYWLGSCYAKLGMTEEAFEWLDRAVDLWFTNHRFMGEYDPLLDDLRGTPRFEAFLERAREKEAGLKV